MKNRIGKVAIMFLLTGVITAALVMFTRPGANSPATAPSQPNLIESLQPYVNEITAQLDEVSPERRDVLDLIADDIITRLNDGKDAKLTFICTHNSRRSHMSQVWAQTAAYYYGLDDVYTFSGGTEATACNIRTVAAMQKAGFTIVAESQQQNPVYLITFANDRPPIQAYSKVYNSGSNPNEDFVALLCCSQADKTCPTVKGATSRYAIHYTDPKECDNTPQETTAYQQKCKEIAKEMFYIMKTVKNKK